MSGQDRDHRRTSFIGVKVDELVTGFVLKVWVLDNVMKNFPVNLPNGANESFLQIITRGHGIEEHCTSGRRIQRPVLLKYHLIYRIHLKGTFRSDMSHHHANRNTM